MAVSQIVWRIWQTGETVQSWAKLNGFKARTVYAITGKERGSDNTGVAKIMDALEDQGLMTPEERRERLTYGRSTFGKINN